MTKKPKIINLSGNRLEYNFYTQGMKKLVVLPDYCPGKGLIPTGSVAIFGNEHVINPGFIGPDIGCGMMLTKFVSPINMDLRELADRIYQELRIKKTNLGSLGGGNHFLNLYRPTSSDSTDFQDKDLFVLIHTGSRLEGKRVFEAGYRGDEYFKAHNNAIDFSRKNRKELTHLVERLSGAKLEIVLDSVHNQVSRENNQVVYRKGAVRINPGELAIIPSTYLGTAVLVRALPQIADIEYSMSHGTGRKLSRSESKEFNFEPENLNGEVYLPSKKNSNSPSEHTLCYRNLEEIFPLIKPYVSEVAQFKPLVSIS